MTEEETIYDSLFKFFSEEHNLTLLEGEIQEIIDKVNELQGDSILSVKEGGWVDVRERLPDYHKDVLCTNIHGSKPRVLEGHLFRLMQGERYGVIDEKILGDKECLLLYGGDFWAFPYICHTNFVTHWMEKPLPAPPITKEEK